MKKDLIRTGVYPIEDVLNQVKFIPKMEGKRKKVDFDGNLINMASDRYKLFHSSITCIECGIQGKYFAMEREQSSVGYHFNLYALDESGNEILMTKDHIIPRALGGCNNIDNYQTMCETCNNNKGVGGLTLQQWKSIPTKKLQKSHIVYILNDWEQSV